jgi:hypothetical protein
MDMINESDDGVKNDFIVALRIIYRKRLSDAFAHLACAATRATI